MARAKPKPLVDLGAEMTDMISSSSRGDDLVFAILCVGFIDQCLSSMLSGLLIESKWSDRIVEKDLTEKSRLLYALGIIPKSLMQNVETLASIRNVFAHCHVKTDFSNPDIIEFSNDLHYTPKFHSQKRPPKVLRPKERFSASAIETIALLLFYGLDLPEPNTKDEKTDSEPFLSIKEHEKLKSVSS